MIPEFADEGDLFGGEFGTLGGLIECSQRLALSALVTESLPEVEKTCSDRLAGPFSRLNELLQGIDFLTMVTMGIGNPSQKEERLRIGVLIRKFFCFTQSLIDMSGLGECTDENNAGGTSHWIQAK